MIVHSFPPVENPCASVLILGSMPGVASLQAGQYYAHPRNAFWPIMGELVGANPSLPYEQRIAQLRAAGIALWDVLHSCTREGSLDAAIVEASIAANDFARFFAKHPKLRHVLFNGGTAQRCFRQYVRNITLPAGLQFHRLPSTSPAHAALSQQQKLAIWRQALASCQLEPA